MQNYATTYKYETIDELPCHITSKCIEIDGCPYTLEMVFYLEYDPDHPAMEYREKTDSVIAALAHEYDIVGYIHTDVNEIEVYYVSDRAADYFPEVTDKAVIIAPTDLDAAFRSVIPTEDIDEFIKSVDRTKLMTELSGGRTPQMIFPQKVVPRVA